CFLYALFQRQTHRRATLTTATETENRHRLFNNFDQRDITTVGSQVGVDFRSQYVFHPIWQRCAVGYLWHLGVRGLDGELPTHLILGVVDERLFKKRYRIVVQIQHELFKIDGFVGGNHFIWRAIGQTGFRVTYTWLGNENTNTHAFDILLLNQTCEIVSCGISHSYQSHASYLFSNVVSILGEFAGT